MRKCWTFALFWHSANCLPWRKGASASGIGRGWPPDPVGHKGFQNAKTWGFPESFATLGHFPSLGQGGCRCEISLTSSLFWPWANSPTWPGAVISSFSVRGILRAINEFGRHPARVDAEWPRALLNVADVHGVFYPTATTNLPNCWFDSR